MKKSNQSREAQQSLSENAQMQQLYAVSQYLEKVTFTHRIMGVDEADVWRKLEKLCELYEDALTAERMKSVQLEQKYDALMVKSKQLLAAYQKLSGKGGENG